MSGSEDTPRLNANSRVSFQRYRDVHRFVTTCESCQMHSIVRHRDELHPMYPPTIHFKWMVDLVTMPMGVEQMRYLVMAREDLTNQVEGRAL